MSDFAKGRVLIMAGITDDPNASRPITGGETRQIACNNRGVLWVNLAAGNIALAGLPDNTDLTTPVSTNTRLATVSRMYGFDATNNFFRRIGARSTNFNVVSPSASDFAATGMAIPVNFDGTFYRRMFGASAANLANQSGEGVQMVTGTGEWAITHAPAANTTATISRAAVASQRHVCKGFSVSLNAVAAIAAPILVTLRDGATGAGTILWQDRLMAPAGTTVRLDREGLNIVGSVNTAMTLEFAAAPGATNFEVVNLNGYTAA